MSPFDVYCQANRGVCLDGMGPVHRGKHKICGERAATDCTLREERLPSTQQCDYHAGKLELGVPCEQASGSPAGQLVMLYRITNNLVDVVSTDNVIIAR